MAVKVYTAFIAIFIATASADKGHKERCPSSAPYSLYGKCYKSSELANATADVPSNVTFGHNFLIAGTVEKDDTVLGLHMSSFGLLPHIYHSVVEFKFKEPDCAKKVRENHSDVDYSGFISIRYNEVPIKLVDLLTGEKRKGFTAQLARDTGSRFEKITSCELEVNKILDLRRYNQSNSYPTNAKYLLFSKKVGHHKYNSYVSHIPTKCQDFQNIATVESNCCHSAGKKRTEEGLVIMVNNVSGSPKRNNNGTIIDPLLSNHQYSVTFSDQKGGTESCQIKYKKNIVFDTHLINALCSRFSKKEY